MKIESTISFQEEYIPPRCRKPRYRTSSCKAKVTLQEATLDEAPVAMRVTEYRRYLFSGERKVPSVFDFLRLETRIDVHDICTIDLRRYKKKLYRLSYNYDHYCGAPDDEMRQPYPVERLKERIANYRPGCCNGDKCYKIKEAREFAKRFLIVNGQVWEVTGEPMYEVCTFGLGHNHANTALMIAECYNPNISNTRYFPANKRAEAIAEGLRVAAARGDTNSFESIRNYIGNIEIIDGIVTRDPANQHGNGDNFLNMIEGITETADSAAEGGLLVCAAALAKTEA